MGINHKLDTHYNGSSQNLEQYRPKLKLPADSWTCPVFHVSKLKKVIGDYSLKAALPKELEVGVGRCREREHRSFLRSFGLRKLSEGAMGSG
jgi:hypothetical protein